MIRLIQRHNDFFVSSKEVADKFGKEHHNVLKAIDNLQVPETYRLVTFEESTEPDSQGIERRVVMMSRDGFSLLAFGFQGKEAMAWKIRFLQAFAEMEKVIKDDIPRLQARIHQLESSQQKQLPSAKTHGNKNTVLVSVPVNTLYGVETEYHRAPRNSNYHSELSYKEGEMKRISQCLVGMTKKLDHLTREVATLRRK